MFAVCWDERNYVKENFTFPPHLGLQCQPGSKLCLSLIAVSTECRLILESFFFCS